MHISLDLFYAEGLSKAHIVTRYKGNLTSLFSSIH